MSTLHIFSSPWSAAHSSQLKLLDDASTLLLCDDACFTQHLYRNDFSGKIVMLKTCSDARNLLPIDDIDVITDEQWVQYTLDANSTITW